MRNGAYVGGNWSNGANAGAFYCNLNNSVSNSNSNLGASHSYQNYTYNALHLPYPLVKINSLQGTTSRKFPKMVQRIRK